MHKLVRFAPWLVGLLVVAAIVFPTIARDAERRRAEKQWPAFQSRFLNNAFGSVRPRGSGVLLTPARHQISRLRTMDGLPFRSPQLLAPGSKFKVVDRHWHSAYSVRAMRHDGVLVDYEGGGVRGQVLVAWK